jgi:hypothetical protein
VSVPFLPGQFSGPRCEEDGTGEGQDFLFRIAKDPLRTNIPTDGDVWSACFLPPPAGRQVPARVLVDSMRFLRTAASTDPGREYPLHGRSGAATLGSLISGDGARGLLFNGGRSQRVCTSKQRDCCESATYKRYRRRKQPSARKGSMARTKCGAALY